MPKQSILIELELAGRKCPVLLVVEYWLALLT
jgi:hypothetical protein